MDEKIELDTLEAEDVDPNVLAVTPVLEALEEAGDEPTVDALGRGDDEAVLLFNVGLLRVTEIDAGVLRVTEPDTLKIGADEPGLLDRPDVLDD